MTLDYVLPDTVKLCIMLQLQIHFKYLRLSIAEMMNDAKEEFCCEKSVNPALVGQQSVPWLYQHRQMKKIILHHKYIIRIANAAETIFNKCVLASFVNLSFLICSILLRLTSVPAQRLVYNSGRCVFTSLQRARFSSAIAFLHNA